MPEVLTIRPMLFFGVTYPFLNNFFLFVSTWSQGFSSKPPVQFVGIVVLLVSAGERCLLEGWSLAPKMIPTVTEEWLADWKHLPHPHAYMYLKYCRAVVLWHYSFAEVFSASPTMTVAARQRREEKLEFEKVQIGDTPINFPFTPYPLQVPHSHKHPLLHLLLNLKMTAHYPLQVKSTPALDVQDANSGCSDLLLI